MSKRDRKGKIIARPVRPTVLEEDRYASSINWNEVSKYEKILKIGQGTYGEVFKAKNRSTGKMVAMKKILIFNEEIGFPLTSLREIKALKALRHRNIINLIEVWSNFQGNAAENFIYSTYLVFDFCEHDLSGLLINPKVNFTLGEKKMLLKQLLEAVSFLHANSFLHRDIKSANILLTRDGMVKLADFGMSRSVAKEGEKKYTDTVVTLWYRPPEVLLGDTNYGPPMDIWSVGCVMAELWTRTPILRGSSEIHQIQLISELCGSINEETWPQVKHLELFNTIQLPKNSERKLIRRLWSTIRNRDAMHLLDRMMSINPDDRIDAESALKNKFFFTSPEPCNIQLSKYKKSMHNYFLPDNPHADNFMENTPLQDEDS